MSNSSASALDLIVDYVNLAKGLNLTRADLSYSQPVLIDPTVRSLFHPTRRNTKVEVEFEGNLSQPRFEITAFYNRLYLGRLFHQVSKHIELEDETSVHELLPKISFATKFNFLPEDVVDGPINEDGTFILEAMPLSMGVFGQVELTTAVDNTPPWISHNARIYLTARRIADFEDGVLLEQTTAEPIYAGRFDLDDNIFFEFSDLSDLTFEGGTIYAIPPATVDYTRLVDSYLNYPDATAYIGTVVGGMRIVGEIEEKEGSTDRLRVFGGVPTDDAHVSPYDLVHHLHWLRFSHPEFDVPINLLLQKGSLTMSNPLLDVLQAMLDNINEQKGLTLTKDDVEFSELTLVDPSITVLSGPSRNSRLRLRTIESDQIDLTITYNRLSLPKLFDARSTVFEDTGQTSITQLLAAINTRTGANLVAGDVVANTIHPQTRTVTLTAITGSLGYFGTINLSLTGDVEIPDPEEGLVTNGFFVANQIGGFLSEDFNTSTPVTDPLLPLIPDDYELVGFASGGFNNEILAVASFYDDDLNDDTTHFYSSHNGGDGDWVDHGVIEEYDLVVNRGQFFQGNAFFAGCLRDDNDYQVLWRFRSTSNEGREYTRENVLEISEDIKAVVATADYLFVVCHSSVHYSANGINWNRVPLDDMFVRTACAHGEVVVIIGQNDESRPMNCVLNMVEGPSVEYAEMYFPEHSVEGDYVDLNEVTLGSTGGQVIAAISYAHRNDSLGQYFERRGKIYTSPTGLSPWTLRRNDTNPMDFRGPMAIDGDLIGVFGSAADGDPPNTYMSVSTNGGLAWTDRNEPDLELFGEIFPRRNWVTLRCYIVGEKPQEEPLDIPTPLNVGSLPNGANNSPDNIVLGLANKFVVQGGGTYNAVKDDDGTWYAYGGSDPSAFYPNGMVNPFNSNDIFENPQGLLDAGDNKFFLFGHYDPAGSYYFANNVDNYPKPVVMRLNQDLTPDWTWAAPSITRFTSIQNGLETVIHDMVLMDDGTSFIIGDFIQFDGSPRIGMMRLLADGTQDLTWASPILNNPYVSSISRSPSGYIAVEAPSVLSPVGQGRSFVMDSSGVILPQMANFGENSQIWHIHDFGDNYLYLFGWMTIGGQSYRVVRINLDGSIDNTYTPTSGDVQPVTVLPNGNLLVSVLMADDNYELWEFMEGGFSSPYGDRPIITDRRGSGAVFQSNGDMIAIGGFDNVITQVYPLQGRLGRENIMRISSGNALGFSTSMWFGESNIMLSQDFKDNNYPSHVRLRNQRNMNFCASHRARRGVAARITGMPGTSEHDSQGDMVCPVSVGGVYTGLNRWLLDICLMDYQSAVVNLETKVILTIGSDTHAFSVTRIDDGMGGNETYYLESDAVPANRIEAYSMIDSSNGGSRRPQSAVTFSIPGNELLDVLLPGHSYPVNADGHLTEPFSVLIRLNNTDRVLISHSPAVSDVGYPLYESNVDLGDYNAENGELMMGPVDGGSQLDGQFFKLTGTKIGEVRPVMALRAYDSEFGPQPGIATGENELTYIAYFRGNPAGTRQYVDMAFGLDDETEFSLPSLYDVKLDLAIITLEGPVAVASYSLESAGGGAYAFAADVSFPELVSDSIDWARVGDKCFQNRLDLQDVFDNMVDASLWDGVTDFTLRVQLSVYEKGNPMNRVGDAVVLVFSTTEGLTSEYPLTEYNVSAGDFFGSEGMLQLGGEDGGSAQDVNFYKYTNVASNGESNPVVAARIYDAIYGPQPAVEVEGLWYYDAQLQDPMWSNAHYLDVVMGWSVDAFNGIYGNYRVTVQFGITDDSSSTSTFARYTLGEDNGNLIWVGDADFPGLPQFPVDDGNIASRTIGQRFVLQDIYELIPGGLWDGTSDFKLSVQAGMVNTENDDELIGIADVQAYVWRNDKPTEVTYPFTTYDTFLGNDHAPGNILNLQANSPNGSGADEWFMKSTGASLGDPELGNPIIAARAYDMVTLPQATGQTGVYPVYNRELYDTEAENNGVEQFVDIVVGHAMGANFLDTYDMILGLPVRNMFDGSGDTMVMLFKAQLDEVNFPGQVVLVQQSGAVLSVPPIPATWTAGDFSSFQIRLSLNWFLEQVPGELWDGTGEVIGFAGCHVYAKDDDETLVASVEIEYNSYTGPAA